MNLTQHEAKVCEVLTDTSQPMKTWPLQQARNHLGDIIDRAFDHGPQRITGHGKQAVIVVSEAEWNRRIGTRQTFGELLASSPLTSEDRPPRRIASAMRRDQFG